MKIDLQQALVVASGTPLYQVVALKCRGLQRIGSKPARAAVREVSGPVNIRYADTSITANAKVYDVLLATRLHDYFGRGANKVMYRLGDLRRDALTVGERS